MKLSLSPLPAIEIVKITIPVPALLKADLERYAALCAETWEEPVVLERLIPHMLEAFLARDKVFKAAQRGAKKRASPADTD